MSIRDWEEHSEHFNELGEAYRKAGGTLAQGTVGMAEALLIPQRELVDFGVDWMNENLIIQEESTN